MGKQDNRQSSKAAATAKSAVAAAKQSSGGLLVPALPIFFLLVWAWAWLYYGSVLQMSREYSFWVPDSRQMEYLLSMSNGELRWMGRALLQTCKYPWLGGLLLAALLSLCSWMTGYCLGLKDKCRSIQYLPSVAYVGVICYRGLNLFFEHEAGYIFALPAVAFVVLLVCTLVVKLITKRPLFASILPSREEGRFPGLTELVVCILCLAATVAYNEVERPFVRTITSMGMSMYAQDWAEVQKTARANALQSNRPMACFYAISLVHTGQIAERMYDIRLDYDSLCVQGRDGRHNNASDMYIPEGSFHGGFMETCMHNCMEQMVMSGPTLRLLKLYVKSALMRGEWALAEKFLRILKDVPFEGDFCSKYGAMVRNTTKIEADPEFAHVRLTEPIHDSFESYYQQPVFMGYNINLVEGRSMQALTNSLCACLYTKLMPQFMERLQPLAGTTPPEIIADGILLSSTKQPGIEKNFPGLDFRGTKIQSFMQNVQPYMIDRAGHAYELFSKYKGYYPYYYFFGNLKATKKGYTGAATSNSGVN